MMKREVVGLSSLRINALYKRQQSKRNDKSFSRHCSFLFLDSMLNGVTSIVKAKGCFQKSLKIFILLFSMAGFLYQTFEFLDLYWKYETVISIAKRGNMMKPALTICDENVIKRTYVCKKKHRICKFYTEEDKFCAEYAKYCDVPKEKIVTAVVENFNPDYFLSLRSTIDGGFKLKDDLINCTWISYDPGQIGKPSFECKSFKFVRGMNKMKFPVACYSIDSITEVKDKTLEYFNFDHFLRLKLKWQHEELLLPEEEKHRYFISIHHPRKMFNPMTQGFSVEEGVHYKVDVKQVDFVRLPAPFSTDCRNYVTEWKTRGGKGPTDRVECQMVCEVELQYPKMKCVFRDVTYPHDKELCADAELLDPGLFWDIQKCQESCKDACEDTVFITEKDVSSLIPEEEARNMTGSPSIVLIDFEFHVKESVKRLTKPKYESIEVFSFIGGYLGMWLGWSLIALLDFLGAIIRLCQYPFTQRRRRKLISMKSMNFVL